MIFLFFLFSFCDLFLLAPSLNYFLCSSTVNEVPAFPSEANTQRTKYFNAMEEEATAPIENLRIDDDDFFGSQEDNFETEQERRNRELESLRRPHYTAGVRQGVSAAHEANVQPGFDDGFIDGAKAATQPAFL